MQPLSEGLPSLGPYVPAPQSRHRTSKALPTLSAYLPATQLMHWSTLSRPTVPTHLPLGHAMHAAALVLPAVLSRDECAAALYSGQSCTASGIACASLTNCFDCATVDGCGWCGADGACAADDGRVAHCRGPESAFVHEAERCDAGLNDQRRVARRLFGRRAGR